MTQAKGTVYIEVTNDDRKPIHPGTGGLAAPAPGSGLCGLAERVTALGGHFDAGPCLSEGTAGFHLQVELPVSLPVQDGMSAVLSKTDSPAAEETAP